MFEFAFDSASLRRAESLALFSLFFAPEREAAIFESLEKLETDAQAYMWSTFKNPTGPLEDSFQISMLDSFTGMIWTDFLYAWRREEGFSGMTDSIGRLYPHDEGIHYMAKTLRSDKAWIRDRMGQAVQDTLAVIGG